MVFGYDVRTSSICYDDINDEEYFDSETIEYEPSPLELSNAIVDIIYNDYFRGTVADVKKFKEKLKNLISYLDIDCIDEYFEEELKDYFEEEAFNSFN